MPVIHTHLARGMRDACPCPGPSHTSFSHPRPPTSAPPPLLQVVRGLDGTDRGRRKIAQLRNNSNYFRARLLELGFNVLGDWDSPVMPVMVFVPSKLPAISRMTLKVWVSGWVVCSLCKGWWVGGVKHANVCKGQCVFVRSADLLLDRTS
jgi:hypothetical protein